MRRFQVEQLPFPGRDVLLDKTAARHATRVLRLKPGQEVLAFDGRGMQVLAELVLLDGRPGVRARGEATEQPKPIPTHLVLGVLKASAMEQALRGATEAGATHIHPLQAARSVPKGSKVDRWERIVASAAQQCGRMDVPEVLPVASLGDILSRLDGVELAIAHPGAVRPRPATGPVAVAIGPEGGFTDAEVDQLDAFGARRIGLGPFILRAATAAPVAVAMLTAGQD